MLAVVSYPAAKNSMEFDEISSIENASTYQKLIIQPLMSLNKVRHFLKAVLISLDSFSLLSQQTRAVLRYPI